jgi:uncharacterized membrane protein YozB (DUF420 family)
MTNEDGGEGVQATGFLGTAAPWVADISLLFELGMGLGLLAGAYLARTKRFRLHAACQSVIVVFNLGLIALAMVPSFHRAVLPRLPGKIGKPYYALATVHATLGGAAELGGMYILLAAGTNLLPERFRIARYRFWMRTILAVWWIVLFLGVATYTRWYVPLR